MPKGFKGQLCVYCRVGKSGPTGDHLVPRSFFPDKYRGNLPKVPACNQCNNTKSKLEHDLATRLPLGNKSPWAGSNLQNRIPPRLARNQKLARKLASGRAISWVKQDSGAMTPLLTIPFNEESYLKFFEYVAVGILYSHFNIYVPEGHRVLALNMSQWDNSWSYLSQLRANSTGVESFADGGFKYQVGKSENNPLVFIGEFQLYGGLQFESDGRIISGDVGVIIARDGLIDNLIAGEAP